MLRRLAPAIALVLAAFPLRAAEISSFTLDNGLEVVVLEDHRAPAVTHMVWYRVGSADEVPGKSGIAHFLEHLMFMGTDTQAPGEFSEVVAVNGGTDNAFTSYDYTGYFQRVAADRLDLMMEMEADRMANLNIAPEFVDSERSVVLEERNQRTETDPGSLLTEQRQAAQYLNHPYGRPIIGWRHEIEALTRDDAVAFYRQHYAPNNAILVVAGDVTPDDVRVLAEKHYGPIPANPDLAPRIRVSEPPQNAERRIVFDDPRVSQPLVIRTYLAPERDPGDQKAAAALTLLSEILGGSGQTSVLARKLQFERAQSVYATAFYSGLSVDDTTFGIMNVPPAGMSLQDAEAALDAAVAEFLDEGIDAGQLERIKTQIGASLIYAEDDVDGLARQYGQALAVGLSIEDVEAWPDILAETTAEEIMAAARAVFDRDRAVTSYLMAPEAVTEVSQ